VIAGVCAVGAIAAVAVIVQGGGPAALLQKAPVYYIKQARAGGVQPPVVYYYLPNEAKADAHPAAQHATAAQTLLAANDTASTKLVCTVDKIKAMSALVQTQWDACKTNPGYVQPNKDAKRRLLGWVWEPEAAGEKKTAKPKHGPEHYHLKLSETDRRFAMHSKLHTEMNVKHKAPAHAMQVLAENATGATGATGSVSFNDCQKKATEEACAAIAGCKNPVCESYYNEPEIEALCGMCTMAPLGCFANSAEVYIPNKGALKVGDLEIGDRVLAASADGKPVSSEVIFMHDHKDVSTTVQIYIAEDMMELTPAHMVAVQTESCGRGYCSDAELLPAKEIRAGDKIYVTDGATTAVQTVTRVSKALSKVRYVVTADDTIVVNGVVASVFSTGAKSVETLPFHMLHKFAKGALQWGPIASALKVILESPALRSIEAVVNRLERLHSQTAKTSPALGRVLATPQVSF